MFLVGRRRKCAAIGRLLVALLLIALAFLVATARAAERPKLTVIGDSIAERMERNPVALASLRNGFRLNLQARACRRLTVLGCVTDWDSGPPVSVLAVVRRFGRWLGRVVVIESGVNDMPGGYRRDLDTVMTALQDARIQTVVWLTVHDPGGTLRLENVAIDAAAKRWPQLVVADWNRYSADQPTWFQADGVHPTALGAAALARFIHAAVVSALQPLRTEAIR